MMHTANIVPFDLNSYLQFICFKCSNCGNAGSIPGNPGECQYMLCPKCSEKLVRDPTSMIGVRFVSNWFPTNIGIE